MIKFRRNDEYNGDSDQAIEDYNKLTDLHPDFSEAYYNRGLAWADKGDSDQAIQDFSKAIQLDRTHAEAYYNRGRAWTEKADSGRAIQDYTKATELCPDHAEAYYYRGFAWHYKDDLDQAIRDYDKAIESDPDFADAYYNRGYALANKGKFDRAIEDYTKAIELNPGFTDVYEQRAKLYWLKDDLYKAIEDYARIIELEPGDASAWYERGKLWHQAGRYDKAMRDYSRAINADPDFAYVYYERASLWKKKGDHVRAEQDMNRHNEIEGKDGDGISDTFKSAEARLQYSEEFDSLLSREPETKRPPDSDISVKEPERKQKEEIENTLGMRFIFVEPGTFMMGSPEDEPGRRDDEIQHRVRLSRGFYMQTTPVTVAQWKRFAEDSGYLGHDGYYSENSWNCKGVGMPFGPSKPKNSHPVTCVSWNEALCFTEWLNRKENTDRYRLPTEAEWEYACRAGTDTPFYFGSRLSKAQANYGVSREFAERYGPRVSPVAFFPPNARGLYDMHGNVWEWCLDNCDWGSKGIITDTYVEGITDPLCKIGPQRVNRGGCWGSDASSSRSASRGMVRPNIRSPNFGFRVVLSSD